MASGIGEFATGVDARLRELNWWKHHVFFFGALLIVLPVVLVSFFGLHDVYALLGVQRIVREATNMTLRLIGLVVIVTSLGALPGYYYDAQQIKTGESDYSPRWLVYSVIHVIPPFGPFVAVPMYVLQRWRHVGIPMHDLFRFR